MMKENEKSQIQQYQDSFQTIIKHPITKVILIGGVAVGIILLSGLIMKVVSNTVINYKGLKEAINGK